MFRLLKLFLALIMPVLIAIMTTDETAARTNIIRERTPLVNASTATPAKEKPGPDLITYSYANAVELTRTETTVDLAVQQVPDDAIVTGIDFKIAVPGENLPDVEIQAAAPKRDLTSIPLQRVTAGSLSGNQHSKEGNVGFGFARTAELLHTFDGALAKGDWKLKIDSPNGALEGQRADISMAVHYNGTAAPFRLRAGAQNSFGGVQHLSKPVWEFEPSPTPDKDKKASLSPSGATNAPSGAQTLLSEGFEGAFPYSGWTLIDNSSTDGGEFLWDDDDYKPYSGGWSAWPANGGANGLDPYYYYYPNNSSSWMIYGPMNLSDANSAEANFKLWRAIEPCCDWLFFGVSTDGTNFSGSYFTDAVDWSQISADLSGYAGTSNIWIGFLFFSDSSVVDDGPFVDDISVTKSVGTCGPFTSTGALTIPDDGSWVEVSLQDPGAPANGSVSEVFVKYVLAHPDPTQLEVLLEKEGSNSKQTIWNQSLAARGLKLGDAKNIQAFNGAPARGNWKLRVRDVVAGKTGQLNAASVRAFYDSGGPAPHVISGSSGRTTTLAIPDNATPTQVKPDDSPKPAAPKLQPRKQANSWELIANEGFEGAFPSSGWTLLDTSQDGCEFLWDDDSYRAYNSAWAAWPANGGANALYPSGSAYPPNASSWMVYGPFDLSTASSAETWFTLWREIEPAFDGLFFGVSSDGVNFNGVWWDGTADWQDQGIDISAFVGDSTVWVAWYFGSDSSVQYEGPWVDDIEVWRNVTAAGCSNLVSAFEAQLGGKTVHAENIAPPTFMPPHPDLIARAKRGEVKLPDFISNPKLKKQRGIDQPADKVPNLSGTWRSLALLVRFTDHPAQVGASYYDTMLFGGGMSTLNHYWRTVSYGALDIVTVNLPSSVGWCLMPQTYAYYVNSNYGEGSYPQNAQKLAEDAVLMADSLVDYTQYDNDHNGYVDSVFIIHSGSGAEYTNNSNDIWSHSWGMQNDPVVDGVRAHSYTTEPEFWTNPGDMTMGVYAHELGHVFGLPDLYDTDYSSEGIGAWSLMAGGSWNGPAPGGSYPALPDPWSRKTLGFLAPTNVTSNLGGASIPAAETSPTAYRLWTNGNSNPEYFLVENRQQTGYDSYLPGAGLLIWHVDENKGGNTAECSQNNNWNCSSSHYKVALEQADGSWNLEHGSNRGDAGDPYPGNGNKRSFTNTSMPNSSAYSGSSDTLVRVQNISNSGAAMTADLQVRSTPPPSANFDAWPQSGNAPLTAAMHIVNTSNITGCTWNYGDGLTGTSCASSHNHVYTSAGTYTVRLDVSGPGGSDTLTRANYIVVANPSKPTKPVQVSPKNGSSAKARSRLLDWTDSNTAAYYSIQVRKGSTTGAFKVKTTSTVSNFTTPNLDKNSWYFWRVRACNVSGCSGWTGWWKFKVLP